MKNSVVTFRTSAFAGIISACIVTLAACGDDGPTAVLGGTAGGGGTAGMGGVNAGTGGLPMSAGATAMGGAGTGGLPMGGGSPAMGGGGMGGAGTGGMGGGGMAGMGGGGMAGMAGMGGVCAAPVEGMGDGLLGQYFDGMSFNTKKFERRDPNVDFNWGNGSPDVNLPNDQFSVRWTGQVSPRYTGLYTFKAATDDGERLTVNGTKVIDHFTDHGSALDTGTPIMLEAGKKYDLQLDYYENGVTAEAHLSWQSDCQFQQVIPTSQLYAPAPQCDTPMKGTGKGLKGDYFDDVNMSDLLVTHVHEKVSFMWGDTDKPDPLVQPGTYSARWTGQVEARATESVTFYTMSDDGVRLFIDDQLVIDNWNDHGVTENSVTLNVVAGQKYNVRLEYYQNGGSAQIKLQWASRCFAREDIPIEQLYQSYTGTICNVPQDDNGTGLKGDYYNAPDFTDLKTTHAHEAVDFDFGANKPDPALGADNFSIRWTGQVMPNESGPIRFQMLSDDGARVWVDGQLLIDNWMDHNTPDNGVLNLTAGKRYNVRVDYREDAGLAVAKLRWSTECQPVRSIPATQLFPDGYTETVGGAGGAGGTDAGGAGGAP